MRTKFQLKIFKERDILEGVGVAGMILLKWRNSV